MRITLPVFKILRKDKGTNTRELEKQNTLLMGHVRNLVTQLQASTDITTNTDSESYSHYIGNHYRTYSTQVAQLGKMYENTADWGCMVARNIIDMRTAFSVGQGIKVKKHRDYDGDATKELKWVKEFMRFNNLDEEMPQEFAKESEIEGKILLRLLVDTDYNQVRVVHVPWRKFNYTVETPSHDFFNYIRAYYVGDSDNNTRFDMLWPFFVYKRFGGSACEINNTPPKTAFVLRQIEDLDKAVWDWRKINKIFAAPTPVITCEDKSTAEEIYQWITGNNWRIGKALVLGGQNAKFEMVMWKGDGYTTLKEETQALVKTISGTTGIPVHFMGYPELLSNRDTAENLMSFIALSTTKERNSWIGAYEELFKKAMMLYNTAFGTRLNPQAVNAAIDETVLDATAATQNTGKPNETVSRSNNTGAQSAGD